MRNPDRSVGADHIGPHGKESGSFSHVMEKCRGILRKRMVYSHSF